MFQHTPKLLMMMLWALMCHHVSAFQEIVLEAPGQSASSSEAIYLNPTLNATNYRHHTRGHYGKNCGRALTQYQAAELWRGYCNEDCSMNPSNFTRQRCGKFWCGERQRLTHLPSKCVPRCNDHYRGFQQTPPKFKQQCDSQPTSPRDTIPEDDQDPTAKPLASTRSDKGP